MRHKGILLLGGLLAISGLGPGAARAADFYAGKTIEVVVPFREGGGTDVWMRVMLPYLQKHIAGNPKILIRNIPGGEAIHGVNQYAQRAKADGLNMVATSATITGAITATSITASTAGPNFAARRRYIESSSIARSQGLRCCGLVDLL